MSAIFYWGAGLLCLAIGTHLDAPYLASCRLAVSLGLLAGGATVLWYLIRARRPILLIALWAAVGIAPPAHAWSDLSRKYAVLDAPAVFRELGPHFIVGFDDIELVRRLVDRNLIGGVFVTRRNIERYGADRLREGIARLQELRRKLGAPPLIVATDQEGGDVSRLSPPLSSRPALSSFANLHPAERTVAVHAHGFDKGHELAAFGINVNFAPVVDLHPAHPIGPLDFHSRIERRAIAAEPAVVGEIALNYGRGLLQAGVLPTLKHFPGLGRADADTHHFPAKVGTSRQVLDDSDWRPFRETLARLEALVMVGHVVIDDIDPVNPASVSRAVIEGVLRAGWGHDGVVITDDLTMGPIYWRGLCRSIVEALNAGVDLLLVAYDTAMATRAMHCAMTGLAARRIDRTALARSRARLRRLYMGMLRRSPEDVPLKLGRASSSPSTLRH